MMCINFSAKLPRHRAGLTVFAVCLSFLIGAPLVARASGTTVTYHAEGVSLDADWLDLSNPAAPFEVIVIINKLAAPGYNLNYVVQDFTGTLFYFGLGTIPDSAVTVSGGSALSGKMVDSVNVNTCALAPTVFQTVGPCGAINLTWTEIPGRNPSGGFTTIRRGSTDTYLGSLRVHSGGTVETANALLQGSLLGFPATSMLFTSTISRNTGVTVTIEQR